MKCVFFLYTNTFALYVQFPAVKKPKTLEKHYHGTLTSLLMDFMSVSMIWNVLERMCVD